MATVNERLRDESIAHTIWVSRYSTGVAKRMVKILNESDAELAARLIVAMDELSPDSFTVTRLEALLSSVRATNAQAVEAMRVNLADELLSLAQHEAGYQLSLFQHLLPDVLLTHHPLVGISTDAVYAAAMAQPFQGRLLSEWASNLEADRLNRITNTVRQGFLLGDTTAEIAKKVRGHANRGYEDGALQLSRSNAASIAKTAVGHMAAVARNSFTDANSDILKGKQWLSTLDTHTTPQCRIRDRLKYTLDNKPIGHKVPYLQGPGKIHFCAVVKGTLISTASGPKPVEGIRLGEMVLTHKGGYEPVTQKLRKLNKNGRIIAINVGSGRVVRVTHDHPILTSTGWKFAGALKVGDTLFSNIEKMAEVPCVSSVITAHSEDYPARLSQTLVAVLRTAELVPANIDLDSDTEVGYGEIEKIVVESILADPSVIMSESELHHLFSLAHLLGENGLKRLGYLLSSLIGNVSSRHSFPSSFENSALSADLCHAEPGSRVLAGVMFGHTNGMRGHDWVGFFPETKEMMVATLPPVVCAEFITLPYLRGPRANMDVVINSELGKASIGEAMISLNCSEREAFTPMLSLYNSGVIGDFIHVTVNSISVAEYDYEVYDLGVGESSSYFADGVLVSNCRSTETLILKSAEELGIDVREISNSTRASMDGQVAADTTYSEWLQRQSFERQKDVVGEKRAILMRDGGMSPDEFYTDKGEWLSLEQLKQRDAQAFKEAGL